MASDLKTEILNDMLAKGYINQEEHQKRLSDENFSDDDALNYYDLTEAYARADEEGGSTFDEIKVKMKQWLQL